MGKGRDILHGVLVVLAAMLWERLANLVSVAMMLLAIGYVVAVALGTMMWLSAGWLLLTMPLGILLGLPAMRAMAKLSQRITD